MDILQERAQVVQQVIDLTVGRDTAQIAENIAELKGTLRHFRRQRAASVIAELMERDGDMSDVEPMILRTLAANGITLADNDAFFEDINRMDCNNYIIYNQIRKHEQL